MEIDTWPWLGDLEAEAGHPLTLAEVPPEAWDRVLLPGVDTVWLMGVWERSRAGLALALGNEEARRSLRAAVPDLTEADLVGSPFCVRSYVVDERLGGPEALAVARARLADRGVRLVLDFVPNHVAPDHPWVLDHPEYLVQGTEEDLAGAPDAWLRADGLVLARGRDPHLPPWPDVVQVNAFHPGARAASAEVLASVAEQCDGVRCDMAMLLLDDVFAGTWGDRVGDPPGEGFWPELISRVRDPHPDLVLLAEVYWDLEWTLLQQGFDLCYDKRLYDRLLHGGAGQVRAHLAGGDLTYQRRLVRFVENHDEARVAAVLSAEGVRAVATAVATLPGATLWHEGQVEGRRVRLPVFLATRPAEPVDEGLGAFHHRLLAAVADGLRTGAWQLLDPTGWPDNPTHQNLLAWAWHDGALPHHVVVVNHSDAAAQARVPLPWPDLRGRRWRLTDVLTDVVHRHEGDELAQPGLYVDLPPRGCHVLTVT